MDSWIRVIIEWVNCLGIRESPINDIGELDDEIFYRKLLTQLSLGNGSDGDIKHDTVSNFIEFHYPEFLGYKEQIDATSNHVYITSLLLITTSQKVSFHRPMCTLKNETQILIKKFLEVMLPFGKSITREIMNATIYELSDVAPRTPPMTPKDRPLKNFFSSPAAQSAARHRMMNERNRELRLLRAQLETERFEKTDLQEDLKIQEEKVISLQKKLEQKDCELKNLKIEKTKPSTPQSCRKNKKQENITQQLRKEIHQFELSNNKLQAELDQLEDEKDELSRKLSSKERYSQALKEKADLCEKNLETLSIQFEMRTNELLDLRLQNEELRSYVKDMQRCSSDAEQSFEVENMLRARSPTPGLNTSEALSSIIDIQLQEAKEETSKLKSDLAELHLKLEEALETCKQSTEENEKLNLKILDYGQMKLSLETNKMELEKLKNDLSTLTDEKNNLIANLDVLNNSMAAKDVSLRELEENRLLLNENEKKKLEQIGSLNSMLASLNEELTLKDEKLKEIEISKKELEKVLEDSKSEVADKNQMVSLLNSQISELENSKKIQLASIQDMEAQLLEITRLRNEDSEQIRSLTSMLASLNEDLTLKDEKLKEIEVSKKELEKVLEDSKYEVADKNQMVSLLNSQISELENSKKTQLASMQDMEAQLLEITRLRNENLEEIRQLNLKLKTREEEFNIIDEKMKEMTIAKIQSDTKLEQSGDKIEQLEKRLVDDTSSFEEKLRILESKIDESKKERERIEQVLKTKDCELLNLSQLIEDKDQTIVSLNAQITKIENIQEQQLVTIKKMESDLFELNDIKHTNEENIQQLDFKLATLNEDLSNKNQKIEEMEHSKEKLEKILKNSEDHVAELEEKLMGETSRFEEHSNNLETIVGEKMKEIKQLELTLANTDLELSNSLQEVERKNETIALLNLKISEIESIHFLTTKKMETNLLELTELKDELHSQLAQERNSLMELTREKRDLELTISTVEAEKSSLINQTTKLAADLNNSEDNNRKLMERSKEYEEKYQNTSDKKALLESECERLNDNISEAVSEISKLKEFQENLENQLTQEHEICTKLVTEKAALEHLLSIKSRVEEDLLQTIKNLEINIEKGFLAHQELQSMHDKVVGECEVASKKIEELKSMATETNLELQGKNSQILELECLQKSLQSQLSEEKSQKNIILKDKESLDRELSSVNEEKGKLIDDLTSSHKKMEVLAEEYKILNCKFVDLEKSNLSSTDDIQALKSEIEAQNSNIREKEMLLAEGKYQYEILSNEKSSLEIKLSSVELEKEKLHNNLLSIQQTLDNVNQEREEILAKSEQVKMKYEEAEKKIDSQTAEIDRLKSSINESAITQNSLTENLNTLSQQFEASEAKSNEFIIKIEELSEAKSHLIISHQEIVKSLEERLQDMQKNLETLQQDASFKEEALAILQSKFNQLTEDKNESESKMNEVIMSLQEIRSSQSAVIETQSKAFAEKELELDNLEKQHLRITEKLLGEIESEKSKNSQLADDSIVLRTSNEEKIKVIEEMQSDLKIEREEIQKLKNRIDEIDQCRLKMVEVSKVFVSAVDNLLGFISGEYLEVPKNMEEEYNRVFECSFDYLEGQELCQALNNSMKSLASSQNIICSLREKNKKIEDDLKNETEAFANSLSTEKSKNDELTTKLSEMRNRITNHDEYLNDVVKKKQVLMDLMDQTIVNRRELEENLLTLKKEWKDTIQDPLKILISCSSACDELKHLESIKIEQEKLFNSINDQLIKNSEPLINILTRTLTWMENNINVPFEELNSEITVELNDEKITLQNELQKYESIRCDFNVIKKKMDEFRTGWKSYESNLKSGSVKREPSKEDKLQIQIDKLNKEKKEMKEKLDAMRVRNAKMEKNMDDIRSENKKLKSEMSSSNLDKSELEKLRTTVQELNGKIDILSKEKEELIQKSSEDSLDAKLKEVHDEYGLKLEKIKQKMKTAYNDQMSKLKQQQEEAIADKVDSMRAKMELQCKKYTEDIAKYKAHISDLSSQFWDVGEKLLAEKQEKKTALQRLQELQTRQQTALSEVHQQLALSQSQLRSASLERDFDRDLIARSGYRAVQLIEEETTTTRRHSVKSIQAMGNAFKVEDEEEIFDNVYLADLKEGQFKSIEPGPDFDRLSELRIRNSLCKPHLRSSYAVETALPVALTEEEIKNGPTHDDLFNDSLSQSLLPGQKVKKKDRTQTSYKRPGPPTPSKNGGRHSLQGNELKSPNPRALKERNDRKTIATPKRLKDFFGGSLSRRQDENAPATPKGRRLSNIFRKPKTTDRS